MTDLIATSGQVIEVPCDYDLVRITTGGNCLVVRGNGVGRIGRIECANTSGKGDCLIIGSKDSKGRLDIGLPKPGKVGGGFLWQQTKFESSHNDGIQARAGFNVHLWDVAIIGPPYDSGVNSSQGVLFQNAGIVNYGPEDVVLHRCVFTGRFTNPVNWGRSNGCGLEDSYVIGSANGGYTSRAFRNDGGGINVVDKNNKINLPRDHEVIAYAYAHKEVPWLTNTPPPPPPPDPEVDPCAAVKAELEGLKNTHAGVLAELALAEGKLDQIKGIVLG